MPEKKKKKKKKKALPLFYLCQKPEPFNISSNKVAYLLSLYFLFV